MFPHLSLILFIVSVLLTFNALNGLSNLHKCALLDTWGYNASEEALS